jgi:outer membrane autotransporter protein
MQAQAQVGVMKLIGKNTEDYSLGYGAYIKTGIAASEASDITLEIGADIFSIKGSGFRYGTIMCPLKAGFRYTLNGTGQGFYIEPQAGYNLVGITSTIDENGQTVNLKYHGVVLAAGTGYLFTITGVPFDLNLRYETVIAHGGSNNMISLGLSRAIFFGNRATY